jgi:hypothetical protein
VISKFDKWNYADMEEQTKIQEGTVAKDEVFNIHNHSFSFMARRRPLAMATRLTLGMGGEITVTASLSL